MSACISFQTTVRLDSYLKCKNTKLFVIRKKIVILRKINLAMGEERKRKDIYVTNEVAYLRADLKISHLRILAAILRSLQEATKQIISSKYSRKTDINIPSGNLKGYGKVRVISMATKLFDIDDNTYFVRKCLTEMKSISCTFRDEESFPGLLAGFSMPRYSRTVDLYFAEQLFWKLLNTEEGYFSFNEAEFSQIQNKYTLRIYWLIQSWKNRGGFVISVDNLRAILSVSKSYERIDNLELKIIRPARDHLQSLSRVWFLYRRYSGKSGEHFAFKIKENLSEEEQQRIRKQYFDYCFQNLYSMGVPLQEIEKFMSGIEIEDYRLLAVKTAEIKDYILQHPNIANRKSYIITSLTTWQNNWLEKYEQL